jgi:hypothetical protein
MRRCSSEYAEIRQQPVSAIPLSSVVDPLQPQQSSVAGYTALAPPGAKRASWQRALLHQCNTADYLVLLFIIGNDNPQCVTSVDVLPEGEIGALNCFARLGLLHDAGGG